MIVSRGGKRTSVKMKRGRKSKKGMKTRNGIETRAGLKIRTRGAEDYVD
jgi:hypothetical protein